MNFKKASREDLLNLEIGSTIVVNLKDEICDIAMFMSFDREKNSILAMDCFMKKSDGSYVQNITEYNECVIVATDRENVLKLLTKKV
jgi:hypothetical protein